MILGCLWAPVVRVGPKASTDHLGVEAEYRSRNCVTENSPASKHPLGHQGLQIEPVHGASKPGRSHRDYHLAVRVHLKYWAPLDPVTIIAIQGYLGKGGEILGRGRVLIEKCAGRPLCSRGPDLGAGHRSQTSEPDIGAGHRTRHEDSTFSGGESDTSLGCTVPYRTVPEDSTFVRGGVSWFLYVVVRRAVVFVLVPAILYRVTYRRDGVTHPGTSTSISYAISLSPYNPWIRSRWFGVLVATPTSRNSPNICPFLGRFRTSRMQRT